MSEIPFYKPMNLNVPCVRDDIIQALYDGELSNGKHCRKLEEILKDMYNSKYAILMPSGTSALHTAASVLFRLDSHTPKRIATQSFTDKSHCGLPYTLAVHIDKDTWNHAEENTIFPPDVITVLTDAFGSISNPILNPENTIWDMAHCIGMNAHEDVFARIISFAPSKHVTMGEGGALITDNEQLYDYILRTRNLYRPTELGAILALYQLSRLEEILRRRREIAENYIDALGTSLQFQQIPIKTNWSRVGCLARTKAERARIVAKLSETVETRQYYEPIFPDAIAMDIYDRMIVLPSYHNVDEHEVIKRIKAVL